VSLKAASGVLDRLNRSMMKWLDDSISLEGSMKVVDPVCKMTIDSEKAAATSEYKGQTIYFCALGCKVAFDKDPEKYLRK